MVTTLDMLALSTVLPCNGPTQQLVEGRNFEGRVFFAVAELSLLHHVFSLTSVVLAVVAIDRCAAVIH